VAAAKAALEQALGVFERLGALLWAQATKAELGRVGLRPAAPVDASGITAAEARVAELVAAGRTNREVAGELFMSPKTVEAHLSRIYRKLGSAPEPNSPISSHARADNRIRDSWPSSGSPVAERLQRSPTGSASTNTDPRRP
jgi:DNA-binding CsgD family transcriptional regulator